MAEATIIRNVGGGSTTEEKVQHTQDFQVKIDGELYSPAITQNVEIEQSGETNKTMDQCTNVERKKSGSGGWLVRVEGIVVSGADAPSELTLEVLRDRVAFLDALEIRSTILNGTYVLSNVIITQSNDLVSLQAPWLGGETDRYDAFEFQLQLGEEESEQ